MVLLLGMAAAPAGLSLFLTAVAAGPACASAGGAPLNIPMSVRQMGRGDVTFMEGDVMRAWTNPALLLDQATAFELAMNGTSMYDSQQNTFGLGAGWLVSPGLALGVLGNSFSAGIAEVNDYGDETGGSLVWNQRTGGVVAALKIGRVGFGGTLKYVSDDVVGDKATAVSYDGGLTFSLFGARLGASVRNMGGPLRPAFEGVPAEVLPLEMRGALGYSLPFWRLSLAGEYVRQSELGDRTGAGVEWWPVSTFGLRAGSSDVASATDRLTYGFTVVMRKMAIDYSLGTHIAGFTHMMSLAYALGPTASEVGAEAAKRVKEGEATRAQEEAAAAVEEAASQRAMEEAARRLEGAVPPPAEAITAGTPVSATAAEPAAPAAPAVPLPAPVAPVAAPSAREPGKSNMVIGIIPFRGEGIAASDAYMISAMFRTEVVNAGTFKVIESDSMDKVLAEQAFQATGCTESDCAVKIGRLLNVQRMVLGTYGIVMDRSVVNIRVVNVETGQIVYSDNLDAGTYEELEKGTRDMATRFSRAKL